MSDLDLEVVKNSLTGADGIASVDLGAVARIRRLDGRPDERPNERSVAISVGGATRIDGLAGGLYEVQLHLPSGTILAQEVEVGGDEASRLTFDAGGAPTGILGWQHYAGAVPSRRGSATGRYELTAREFQFGAPKASLGDDDAPDETFASGLAGGDDQDRPKLLVIEVPESNEAAEPDGTKTLDVWRALALGVQGELRPVPMVKGFICRRQDALEASGGHDSWRFGFAPERVAGKRPPRRFAQVQIAGTNELVSLPLPWRMDIGTHAAEPYATVDLLVDTSSLIKPVRSSVMVRDAKYSGLIAYMNNGALSLAGELIRAGVDLTTRAIDMLSDKSRSPLGACAAAYVLLSTSSLDEPESEVWLRWIDNLGNNPEYSWIPDAALLCARVRLLNAESEEQAREAIPWLHRALRNGLPFYSLGLSWLLEALTHFRKDDRVLEAVFADVDKVARYLDVSQTFLVLKFDAAAS